MFLSGARTWHTFHLAALICLTLAVATRAVTLRTTPQVVARCGDNVTLVCVASSPHQIDIKLFSWGAQDRKLCEYKGDGGGDAETLCQRVVEPEHSLNLTLVNIMPVHQGKYFCKLHSLRGMLTKTTNVKVHECFGSGTSSVNGGHATCKYGGIYPDGEVHWFSGEDNLTSSARMTKEKDQQNMTVIESTISVESGRGYNCSLWLPDAMKYVSSQQLHAHGLQISHTGSRSSRSVAALHWFAVTVGVALVGSMMW